MGTGTGACTIVSVSPLPTKVQCLLTAVFGNGEIAFGGVAPLPVVGTVAQFGILGGTDEFKQGPRGSNAHGPQSHPSARAAFDLE